MMGMPVFFLFDRSSSEKWNGAPDLLVIAFHPGGR